ncbi:MULTISPECIES: YitT family protein [unclassified Lactobacillus]|uniref:YitT family protein n=1 Tax=unclassified Lactobacillus TaxID=2620435 RepID=UPI000EFBFF06|nr:MULTISPECIES: YitT family protein [unclassified Lactobacillus]RMC24559.1 YitT family protein [Lactobacillus sp. ESL0247]RMC28698.1 YitT family protein [Lactobacillus sp. ESL0246]RMC31890.1 YitT family protein [Lactobacillus sp. ESL0245]RMC49027.1 YitT family protein [Lactobacillus sp. ESL0228]
MQTNKHSHTWQYWLFFLAGLEIITVAINFFYAPINVAAGGSTGISILVDAVWGINRSLTVFIVNSLMLILAVVFLGKATFKKVALGSLLLPVLMAITPSFKLTSNNMLAVIYGGVLMGIGVSMLYRINASSGGTTIPPLIIKKYFFVDPAMSLMAIDMVIIVLNIFVDGTEAFLLAAFSQIITTITMRYAETGFDKKFQVRIMSNEKLDKIKTMLQKDYDGLTVYNVVGGYSDENKQQLVIIVDTNEYGQLVSKAREIDSEAFIVTENVAKVHGGKWQI